MSGQISVPGRVAGALDRGAALAVSISGGKDSQAMLSALVRLHGERGWRGDLIAVHADLGRAEWHQTSDVVQAQASRYGVPLHVVRRRKGDLFHRIESRLQTVSTVDPTRPAKPFFPSAAQRYCTAELKRDPINSFLRRYSDVVSAIGLRAEESPARRKKMPWQINSRIDCGKRDALIWHPVLDWTAADIWSELGTSEADLLRRQQLYRQGSKCEALEGWSAHPAYVFGNQRLSCALCVLASQSDLENGARHNPEAYQFLLELEERSGYTFKNGWSLAQLKV